MDKGLKLVSGGTDNHLLLIDLRTSDLSGKDAEIIFKQAGITVNKNTVPGETRKPAYDCKYIYIKLYLLLTNSNSLQLNYIFT